MRLATRLGKLSRSTLIGLIIGLVVIEAALIWLGWQALPQSRVAPVAQPEQTPVVDFSAVGWEGIGSGPTTEVIQTPIVEPVIRTAGPLVAQGDLAEVALLFDVEEALEYVETLTCPEWGGRQGGSPGSAEAAAYIADKFEEYGLQPAGTDGYFQPFLLPYAEIVGMPTFVVTTTAGTVYDDFAFAEDFRFAWGGYSGGGVADGRVFWLNEGGAGDYHDLDVTDGIVFCKYSRGAEVTRQAVEHGASGLILLAETQRQVDTLRTYREPAYLPESLPTLLVTEEVAEALLDGSSYSVQDLSILYESVPLATVTHFEVCLDEPGEAMGRNVLGVLPGADPARRDEVVVVGGHYDHVGIDADGSIYYWTDDGIYRIGASELGDYRVTSLTEATIKTYFLDLVKDGVRGQFDEFTRKISWLTGEKSLAASDAGTELVFDTVTQSFSTLVVAKIPGASYPLLFGQIKAGAFTTGTLSVEVTETSGAVITTTSGDPVTLDSSTRSTGLRSNKYIALVSSNSGKEQFTISSYNNLKFKDWESIDGTGVDAGAHLTMGYMTGGEIARNKQAPIVTFHFERTEQGFVEDATTGAIDFDNPSSCFLQFQWDWADSDSSNRWSVSRQAYRLGRYVLPANVGDSFDYGFSSVITKNKIRGKGRALSLHLTTEEEKDCKVLGYSMDIFVNGAV